VRLAHRDLPPPTADQGYERSGVNLRGIWWFLAIFIVGGAVIHVGLFFLYEHWVKLDRSRDVAPTALMDARPMDTNRQGEIFPSPQLQPSPGRDRQPWQEMSDLLLRENQEFERRGWRIDSDTHQPVIPETIVAQVIGGAAATTQATPAGGAKQ
jgi:hypothetical protein